MIPASSRSLLMVMPALASVQLPAPWQNLDSVNGRHAGWLQVCMLAVAWQPRTIGCSQVGDHVLKQHACEAVGGSRQRGVGACSGGGWNGVDAGAGHAAESSSADHGLPGASHVTMSPPHSLSTQPLSCAARRNSAMSKPE